MAGRVELVEAAVVAVVLAAELPAFVLLVVAPLLAPLTFLQILVQTFQPVEHRGQVFFASPGFVLELVAGQVAT